MQITAAINERRYLTFVYDGYSRTVEPHTFGVDKKGHTALRAYQVAGGSESGEYVGWKLFHVDRLGGIRMLPEHFSGARPDYKRNDSAFSNIHAQL